MDRLKLFPDTTLVKNNVLTIGGCNLTDLADTFGTPLYLYDRATMDNAVEIYLNALSKYFPGKFNVAYASKAFLCLAIAEWTQQHDLLVDCSGAGEIAIAIAAGVSPERLLVHGVNKQPVDLEAACEHARLLVVDNLTELRTLEEISHFRTVPDLMLRYKPGLEVATHAHTQTGQVRSKFGLDAEQIMQAAHFCREYTLPLTGLHFHLGSQFNDPTMLTRGIGLALDMAEAMGLGDKWRLSPGGGWGVAYNEDELPHPDVADYVRVVSETLLQGCKQRKLSLPWLHLEPGRSLIARAGVALYRVGITKRSYTRVWALLDGGIADNPRPALYGARYSALPVEQPKRPCKENVWFGGPYCESGDVLIEALPFPEVQEGELVAVPVSGAYQLSMSSNYNGARRPAVVWLDHGQAQIIQAREADEDLFRRDHRLAKPAGTG
jgi:diaminopimelate decarboxylase